VVSLEWFDIGFPGEVVEMQERPSVLLRIAFVSVVRGTEHNSQN